MNRLREMKPDLKNRPRLKVVFVFEGGQQFSKNGARALTKAATVSVESLFEKSKQTFLASQTRFFF